MRLINITEEQAAIHKKELIDRGLQIEKELDLLYDKKNIKGKVRKKLIGELLVDPIAWDAFRKICKCTEYAKNNKGFHLPFAFIKNTANHKNILEKIAAALNCTTAARKCEVIFYDYDILALFKLDPCGVRMAGHGEIAFILLPFDSYFNNSDNGGSDLIIEGYKVEVKCPGSIDIAKLPNTLDGKKLGYKTEAVKKINTFIKEKIKEFAAGYDIPSCEISMLIANNMWYSISPAEYVTFKNSPTKKTKNLTVLINSLGNLAEKYSNIDNSIINEDLYKFKNSILNEYFGKIYFNRADYDQNVLDKLKQETTQKSHYNDSYYYLWDNYDQHLNDKKGRNRWNTCPFINWFSLYATKILGNDADFIIAFNGDFNNKDTFNMIIIDKSMSADELVRNMVGYHFIVPTTHEISDYRFPTRILVY